MFTNKIFISLWYGNYVKTTKKIEIMKIQIETILTEDSTKLINSTISYTNSLRTLREVVMALRDRIHNLNLHKDFDCGSGSNHIWLSRLSDGERILFITQ